MLNNDLEVLIKSYKKRRLKDFFLLFVLLLLVVALLGASYIYFFTQKQKEVKQTPIFKEKTKAKSVKKVMPKVTHKVATKAIKKPQKKKKVITPAAKYRDIFYSVETPSSYIPNIPQKKKRTKSPQKRLSASKKTKKQVEKPLEVEQKPQEEPKPKENFKINKTDIDTRLNAMQKQFSQDENFDVAIKIAQAYLRKRDYKSVILWAKKANIINREDEASWILYAKAEKALGHKNRAINILQAYLQEKKSVAIESLLMEWEQ